VCTGEEGEGHRLDSDGEASFLDYVRAEMAALSRIAYLLTGDWHLAQDLVQETLLRVVGQWRRITAAGDPHAYVRRVMYHQHVSWWRRSRLRTVLMANPPDRITPDHTDTSDVSVAVCAALAQLSPRQRAVLVLRFLEDRTEQQTADLLGCRIGTVKSHTREALSKLRRIAPGLAAAAGVDVDQSPPDRNPAGPESADQLATWQRRRG
jgi:RNA polymerase sigma-70 factor (sigma-E family)